MSGSTNPASNDQSIFAQRQFLFYLAGQGLSQLGTKMQGAAILWHLYTLAPSPYALGAFGAVRLVPLLLLGLIGGIIADRNDCRRLLLRTEPTMGLLAAGLAWWTYRGLTVAWPLYVFSAISAVVMAFGSPARQALLPTIVPVTQLARAVALDALAQKVASVLGPVLMGVLITRGGPQIIYTLNALSYIAIVGVLLVIRSTKRVEVRAKRGGFAEAIEAVKHLGSSPLLGPLLAMDFAASFLGSSETMLPLFASQILHVGPEGFGLLAAAAPTGAVIASFVAALGPGVRQPWRRAVLTTAVYGAAIMAFGLSRHPILAFAALMVAAGADTMGTLVRNTLRHATTPENLRGRVAALNQLLSKSGPRLGELEAGVAAGLFGLSASIVLGGAACIASLGILVPIVRRRTLRAAQVAV